MTGAHECHQCGAWEGQKLQAEGARGARTWKGRLKAHQLEVKKIMGTSHENGPEMATFHEFGRFDHGTGTGQNGWIGP